MKKVCMVVQDRMVKGGIAAVIGGYYGSELESNYNLIYVESYKDGGKFAKLTKAIGGYFHFAKVLLIDKPDLIHIHSSFGPSFYRKLPFIYMASWAGKPIINHIHGADFKAFYTDAGEKKRRLIRKAYGKCKCVIALSNEWKHNLSQIVPTDKISVIENYSTLHKECLEERLARPCNRTVLFLGELGRRKGCYDIPAILEQVVKRIPDVKFVLGGAGSEKDETAIKKLFAEKNLLAHVEFPGWVRGAEKDALLRKADVFFLPSYNEGMPMSVLDAMGYGLAVVSTNVGGIPKIVQDDKNGCCCVPGDTQKMAESIADLLQHEARRKEASCWSMRIVEERYSLDAHLRKLEDVYEEALKK